MQRFLIAVAILITFTIKADEPAPASIRPEFYIGVSVGHDRLSGKRNEDLLTHDRVQLFFSNDKTQRTNAVSGKLITGFLWTIPNTAFVLSPEIYIGLGSGQITLQATGTARDPDGDPDGDTTKNYQSTFKQTLTIGIVLRAGFYLTGNNNFLYGLIGIGKSKFQNTFTLTSTNVGNVPAPALVEKRTKSLKSPVFGVGFEKKFTTFKVGIDCRYMPYATWGNYSKEVPISEDKITIRFKPKVISTSLTFSYLF